jgi:hypothetical protein
MAFDPNNSGEVQITTSPNFPALDYERYALAFARTFLSNIESEGAFALRGTNTTITAVPLNGANFAAWLPPSDAAAQSSASPVYSFLQQASNIGIAQFENGPCSFFRGNGQAGPACGCDEVVYPPPILPGDYFEPIDCEINECGGAPPPPPA